MNARWRFLLLSFGALLAVSLTFGLGRWQLARAAQKEALQAHVEAQAVLPGLDDQALLRSADFAPYLDRKVALRGRWVAHQTVFLENRQMNAKVGLHVITPLQLSGGQSVILVQRGWVARNFLDRTGLPALQTPDGEVQIQGRIAPPPSKLFEPGKSSRGLIRQNLDLAEFASETGLALLPVSAVQTDPASHGLLRDWPRISTGVEKHYAYAFQWFALSALIAFLYFWFQIVKRFFYRPQP